jgi:hypothetical protein
VNAGISAKHLLNSALFPVSVGAVVNEIVTVVAIPLKSGITADIGGWAGLVAATAALLFQIATRKKQ